MINHMAEMDRLDKAFYVDAAAAAKTLLTPEMEAQCLAEVKASYGADVEFVQPFSFAPEVAKLVRHQVNRHSDRNNRSASPMAALVTTCKVKDVSKGTCGCYYELHQGMSKLVFIRRLEPEDFVPVFPGSPVIVSVPVRRR
jgi:hypothetical protein